MPRAGSNVALESGVAGEGFPAIHLGCPYGMGEVESIKTILRKKSENP